MAGEYWLGESLRVKYIKPMEACAALHLNLLCETMYGFKLDEGLRDGLRREEAKKCRVMI